MQQKRISSHPLRRDNLKHLNDLIGFEQHSIYLHCMTCYFCCTSMDPFFEQTRNKLNAIIKTLKYLDDDTQQFNIYMLSGMYILIYFLFNFYLNII